MFKIDINNIKSIEEKEMYEEKLGNRIVLNVVYTFASLILLFVFYRFSTGFKGTNTAVVKPTWTALIILCVLFLISAIVFYILGAKLQKPSVKSSFKNHAHMFLGFAAGTFIVNLHKYLSIFLPIESTSGAIRKITEPFRNIYFNFKLTAILIVVAFVLLMAYNFYVSKKLSSVTKKSIAKNR